MYSRHFINSLVIACSKSTMETLEKLSNSLKINTKNIRAASLQHRSNAFVVGFEQILYHDLVFFY